MRTKDRTGAVGFRTTPEEEELLDRAMEKLGKRSRSEVVRYAIWKCLLPLVKDEEDA